MSWWDTKQLTSLASQALKTAQKKIDKVLDIKEENIESEIQLPNIEELQEEQKNKWALSEIPVAFEDHTSLSSTQTHADQLPQHKENNDESSLLLHEDEDNKESSPSKHLTSLEKQLLKRKTNKIGSTKSAFRKVRNVKNEADKPQEITENKLHDTSFEKQNVTNDAFDIISKTHKTELTVENNDGNTKENIEKSPELSSTQHDKNLTEKNMDEYDGKSLKMEDIPNEMKDSSCWSDASLSILNDNFGDLEISIHNSLWENKDVKIEDKNNITISPLISKNDMKIAEVPKTPNEAEQNLPSVETLLLPKQDNQVLEGNIVSGSNSYVNTEGVENTEENPETTKDVEMGNLLPESFESQSEMHSKEAEEEKSISADDRVEEILPVLETSENGLQSTIIKEGTIQSDEVHTLPLEDTLPPLEINTDEKESSETHTLTIKTPETKTDSTHITESNHPPLDNQKVDLPTPKSPFDQKTSTTSSMMSSSSSSASTTVLQRTSDASLQEVKLSSDDDSTPTLQSLNNSISDSKDSTFWKVEESKEVSFTLSSMENSTETYAAPSQKENKEEKVEDKLEQQEPSMDVLESSLETKQKADQSINNNDDNDNTTQNDNDKKDDKMHHENSPHNSEHTTSADEIDTTTSSDIEIISQISTPSLFGNRNNYYGDKTYSSASSNGLASPSNPGSHSKNTKIHNRSDSGSSKGGDDFVNVDYIRGGYVEVSHRKRHPEESGHLVRENENLMRKLGELAEVLESRERKLMEMSRENMDLKEDKSILKSQLSQLEDVLKSEKEDVEDISKEFSKRIADSENKFQQACKEKELLKKNLQEIELRRRSDNASYDKVIQEKEETIAELLAEGEKLSKQQLQSNNLVKKLRSKEKESDNTIKNLKQKTEEQKVKIANFENVISGLVDTDKQQLETINQLNSLAQSNQETIFKLKNDLEDSQAQALSFKSALDNSYKEMSELQKRRMLEAGEAQKLALSGEEMERLKEEMALEKERSKQLQLQLMAQVDELRESLHMMEGDEVRKEEMLKQEITELQKRLQESEDKNQELSQNVSSSTKPLLRQLETLQNTYRNHCSAHEKTEKILNDKLAEQEEQLNYCLEREKMTSEKYKEVLNKLSSSDSELSSLRREKGGLEVQLKEVLDKMTSFERSNSHCMTHKDNLIKSLEEEISQLKKEKLTLEGKLDIETSKLESEKKRTVILLQQISEKESLLKLNQGKSGQATEQSFHSESRDSTPLDEKLHSNQSSFLDSNPPSEHTTPSATPTSPSEITPFKTHYKSFNRQSVYESSRGMLGTSLVENLQSMLKMRAVEINQLQNNMEEMERTRDSLSDQVVDLTIRNEKLNEKMAQLEEMKVEFENMTGRYNALLQMYGEKEEQVQELTLDLQEFKQIYKQQMNEVLRCKSQNLLE